MMTGAGFFKGKSAILELARDTSFFASTSSASVKSSDARPIGAASPTRQVYAFVAWRNTVTLSSATIGGVTAAILEVSNVTAGSGAISRTAILVANVPTGTTAVVACTFSGNVRLFAAAVVALNKVKNPSTPIDSASSNSAAVNIDAVLNGYIAAVGLSISGVSKTAAAWTYLTESAETAISDGGEDVIVTLAFKEKNPVLSNQAVSCSFTPGIGSGTVSAVSLR